MKNFILGILLLFSVNETNAQYYNCFTPGVNRYFLNGNRYIRGMRIDSLSALGTNLVYHPYRTPRGEYPHDMGYQLGAALDPNGGSWLGKDVIRLPDGSFLFHNLFGDTIVIRTQCTPGDSWVFYNDSTSIYYTANCLSADTITILGQLDSMKTIQIQCSDTTDMAHSFEIILSKHNGFYQVFDLYTFPYRRLGMPIEGADCFLDRLLFNTTTPAKELFTFTQVPNPLPRWSDLYDMQVGDVLFYQHLGANGMAIFPESYWVDTIISKTVSSNGVTYNCRGLKWWDPGIQTPTLLFMKDTTSRVLFYPNTFVTDKMPEEYKEAFLYSNWRDDQVCPGEDVFTIERLPLDSSWYQAFSSSWTEFKRGVGLSKFTFYAPNNEYDTTLVWFKRGNFSCGQIPFIPLLNTTDPGQPNPDVEAYPNPVQETLYIRVSCEQFHVSMYNALGKLVYEATKGHQVDVTSFSSGIYYLQVKTDTGIYWKKIDLRH